MRPTYHFWTPAERALLASLWSRCSVAYIARRLRMSGSQVRNQAAQMGLPPRVRGWTTAEEIYLSRYYGERTAVQIGIALARGADAVRRRAMIIRRRCRVRCCA